MKRDERSATLTVQILSNDNTVLGESTVTLSFGTNLFVLNTVLAANSKKQYVFFLIL